MPKVYPVDGLYLSDVPAVEHECDDERCLETGAFTKTKPKPQAADDQTEIPASAGVLDSEE